MASNAAGEETGAVALPGLDRLEHAARRLIASRAAWLARARAAEARARELQAALEGVRTGALDPRELGERVAALERENAALRHRLQDAAAIVQRIQARLQLLEDER
jgi:hypothetical protein